MNRAAKACYDGKICAMPGNAARVLRETSRTFYQPIMQLPVGIREAVSSAYLCLRAIDEIEDHPKMPAARKVALLHKVAMTLRVSVVKSDALLWLHEINDLPEVSTCLAQWLSVAPPAIRLRIVDCAAGMAMSMAFWADRHWRIDSPNDVKSYMYEVAGTVGVLMCDLCAWFDGIQHDRDSVVAIGLGLQAVNIINNRDEDMDRGVNFIPPGWTVQQLDEFALRMFERYDSYASRLNERSVLPVFFRIPHALASATLQSCRDGRGAISRRMVEMIVKKVGDDERPI